MIAVGPIGPQVHDFKTEYNQAQNDVSVWVTEIKANARAIQSTVEGIGISLGNWFLLEELGRSPEIEYLRTVADLGVISSKPAD